MRIAVIGGGPGGLYFALLAKQLGPEHEITVWERNAPDDTFGFGVVFSDETLGGIEHADPAVHRAMEREFARWDDIDIRFRPDPAVPATVITSGGHGFAAMSRRRLLAILQDRCRELGVRLHFRTAAPDPDELAGTHDLVVAADGVNSPIRAKYADRFRPTVDTRQCRYMWLGTDRVFDAFTFDVRRTPYGVMQVHAYPYDATGSTFIVEMHDPVWRRAGFDRRLLRPRGERPGGDRGGRRALRGPARRAPGAREQLPLDQLRHGPLRLLAGRQRGAARRRRAHRALLHRLRHQAGHGGRARPGRVAARAVRLWTRRWPATTPSGGRWWCPPSGRRRPAWSGSRTSAGTCTRSRPQFAFNLLTRSRRVTLDNLRLRDPEFVSWVEGRFTAAQRRGRGHRARRRCSTRSGCAGWSCATG